MDFYTVTFELCNEANKILNKSGCRVFYKDKPNEINRIDITWDNVDTIIDSIIGTSLCCETKRKGRVVYTNPIYSDLFIFKEWKDKLNLHMNITYEVYKPSLEFIFKWHNADESILYLKEKYGIENIKFIGDKK